MKTQISILLLCTAVLCSCSRPDMEDPSEPYQPIIELGKVAMDRDSLPWTANFTCEYTYAPETSAFSFYVEKFRQNNILEIIGFDDIPTQPGMYHFGKTLSWAIPLIPKVAIAWSIDGDQFLGMVSADSTYYEDNRVEVVRYDSVAHTVEGRFQVRLRTISGTPGAYGLPEQISLTNGRFHLKIEE
ncbi:MAG: hypothetical protein IT259_03315 [Saprospiraceae bacterium]|nr:hypothetical protein [Saprospiraceae bacterium]